MELIFVHGALVRDGRWWWQPAAELLRERTGIRSRALALPSCGETLGSADRAVRGGGSDSGSGLVSDAAALRRELDAVDATDGAIVVGHSYGGTVIAEAGRHPAVAHLLYVSSYLPEPGQSQGAITSGESDPVAIGDRGDGTLELAGYDASTFGERFLQDAEAATQRAAFERVTAQSAEAFVTPTTAAGWQGADSTYLVCLDDRSTSTQLQRRHAERATRSVDLPTGHHPFITRPDLVVRELSKLM
jgi:pimeloyl-ACP methyl ester carboxylesterase